MKSDRPNLLFVFTDEQRRDTLACYGNDYAAMPNLNRLADSSCVFDEAYCTNPVCTPSRGSIMTGLYPHAHGATDNNIPLRQDARCLPECLPPDVRRDYRVEYHGKWHLGDELYAQHGYERFVSVEDIYWNHFSSKRDRRDRSDYHHYLLSEGFRLGVRDVFPRAFASQLPEHYCKPRFLADHACQFIRQHRDRPWMLTVSILEPHMPFHSCRDGQYDEAAVPMFSNFNHVPDAVPHETALLPQVTRDRLERYRRDGYQDHDLNTEAGWRELTARYLGLCSLVDTHIGRILDTVAQQGLSENTIVVFSSDHGEMMGSHHLLEKSTLYREATMVPLLIRLPGQRRAARLGGPISQIDLMPTLLDLLGADVPEGLHGRSLAPLLREASNTGRAIDVRADASPCVIVQDMPTVASRTIISTDGWRYSNYTNTGELELFNLNTDPGERHNLAAQPEQRARLADLHRQLQAWQKDAGDDATLAASDSMTRLSRT